MTHLPAEGARPRISKLGWLALMWSLVVPIYLAFAPFGTTHEFDNGWVSWVSSGFFDEYDAVTLTIVGIPVLFCLSGIMVAHVTRSGVGFGVASILLLIWCYLSIMLIGLFYVPSAALLAFAAGRTPRPVKIAVPAGGR